MSQSTSSRRQLLRNSALAASAATLASIPKVHAAENNTIHLALIGCGGRGSGAAVNAFESPSQPVKLIAMADLFEKRLQTSHKNLSTKFPDKVDVPADRQFIGFDAYKKAIDCLKPGDVAMLTGYAGFRPNQLEYAISKGINVFMEKSFAADPFGCQRVIRAAAAADAKGLKIAAGLQCRHSPARHELIRRIREGELGDIHLIRGYRMQPVGPMGKKPPAESELMWQTRNFTSLLWVAGGLFAEMNIHQIDEICWIKDSYPISAHGIGGRSATNTDPSQNLDTLQIEYTFADGAKAFHTARWMPKCHTEFATYIHGTKKAAQFSGWSHASDIRIFKDQRCSLDNIEWKAPKETASIWEQEWTNLLDAIRQNKPHNEAKRAALSNLADIMGRAAIHTGQIVTWDQVMASTFQFFPGIDTLTPDSAPPFQPDPSGRYPVPVPGTWKEI